MPAKKKAKRKVKKKAAEKKVRGKAGTKKKSTKKAAKKKSPKTGGKKESPKKKLSTPVSREPVVVSEPPKPEPAIEMPPDKPKKEKLGIDCEHCEGTGVCAAGTPYDKSHGQMFGAKVRMTSCVDCLLAAGEHRNSKKLVNCRICEGDGKV
jgi:hypothetical protein